MRAMDKQLATLQLGYHFDQVLHWESFIADLVYCCHQREPTVVYMGPMKSTKYIKYHTHVLNSWHVLTNYQFNSKCCDTWQPCRNG